MQNLETTILGTALPQIAKAFGQSPVNLHLILTSYLMSLAIFMPISGWMADRFGTRRVFQLAILIFTAASVACAFAGSLEWMIVARIVQGVGGAMMVPVARLALLRTVPKAELVSAMTWVAVPALLGPVVGPPLGGLIVTYASWPWVFWINVPIGMVGLVLAGWYIEDVREPDVPPFDGVGFVLCSIGIAGLVFGLDSFSDGLLPAWAVVGLLLGGLGGMALYLLHARRKTHPLLDLSLLKIPTFRASVVGGAFFRFGIGAMPFLLPLMLQTCFGRSPLSSGLITFAAAGGALLMKFVARPILNTFGFRNVLTWNAILSAISILGCAFFDSATPALLMFGILLIGGFFRSLEFTAINTLGYADLSPRQMGRATSFVSMAQQMSLSIGVGIGATALTVSSGIRGAEQLATVDFTMAFIVVAVLASASSLLFARLPKDAGDEVANRLLKVDPAKLSPSPVSPPSASSNGRATSTAPDLPNRSGGDPLVAEIPLPHAGRLPADFCASTQAAPIQKAG